jgi:hypothetical protein
MRMSVIREANRSRIELLLGTLLCTLQGNEERKAKKAEKEQPESLKSSECHGWGNKLSKDF